MASDAFVSNGQSISGELFSPSSGSGWRTVVVAYGTEGMKEPFGRILRDFCTELARNGFLALIPDFFPSTGTTPGFETVFLPNGAQSRFDRWINVLQDANSHVQTISGSAAGRASLVGFSLGGHLALRAAAGPSVKAVVDFYGPLTTVGSLISQPLTRNLPPVQVHHGDKDRVVSISDSETLDGWLNTESVAHEFHRYPHDGHPGQEKLHPPGWSTQSQSQATALAVKFLSDNS